MLTVAVRYGRNKLLSQPTKCLAMLGVGERHIRHTDELLLENRLAVLQNRVKEFVQGPVVAERKREKSVFDFFRDFVPTEELRDIEEVPRVLAIQRGAELASVEFGARENGHLRQAEKPLRDWAVGKAAHGEYRSAQNIVRLDLDDGVPGEAEYFSRGIRADKAVLDAKMRKPPRNAQKRVANVANGRLAIRDSQI